MHMDARAYVLCTIYVRSVVLRELGTGVAGEHSHRPFCFGRFIGATSSQGVQRALQRTGWTEEIHPGLDCAAAMPALPLGLGYDKPEPRL